MAQGGVRSLARDVSWAAQRAALFGFWQEAVRRVLAGVCVCVCVCVLAGVCVGDKVPAHSAAPDRKSTHRGSALATSRWPPMRQKSLDATTLVVPCMKAVRRARQTRAKTAAPQGKAGVLCSKTAPFFPEGRHPPGRGRTSMIATRSAAGSCLHRGCR